MSAPAVLKAPYPKLMPGMFGFDDFHGDGAPTFQDMADEGYAFVFQKAEQGLTGYKGWFDAQMPPLLKAGLIPGAYDWPEPGEDPIAQIADFFNGEVEFDFPAGYPLDLEQTFHGGKDAWTRFKGNEASQFVRALLAALRDWGVENILIYSTDAFWRDMIWGPADDAERALLTAALVGVTPWIARYPHSSYVPWSDAYLAHKPAMLEGFAPAFWIWQWTDKGRVKGFSGDCDLNRVFAAEAA